MFKRTRMLAAAVLMTMAASFVQAADHPAQILVEDAISTMFALYQDEGDRLKSDPEFLQEKIDELIMPNLDFETMTKLAVSKFWRRADADQHTALVDEFTTLLLNTYTSALTQYSGDTGTIKFAPFRAEKRDDRAVVRSTFTQSAGADVPVLYKLRDNDGWKIYDIEVNDVSLVTGYRSAFSNEIEKNGIDGLIETLKERNGKS